MREGAAERGEAAPVALTNAVGIGGGGMLASQEESGKAASSIALYPVPPRYEPVVYKYVYKGEEMSSEKEMVDVLKRMKGPAGSISSGFISQMASGLVDFSKFRNVKARHVSLYEDIDNGYEISFSPAEGFVSMNLNWEKRVLLEDSCHSEDCRLKLEDVPEDVELISIASAFLDKYGIDTGIYGDPFVDKQWIMMRTAEEGEPAYVPEYMNVKYPLEIGNGQVYDSGGGKEGLSVGIDIRNKIVSSAYGIYAQNYQSSAYQAETDWNKILEVAGRGGVYYGHYEPENAKVVEIGLGTPESGFMKYWMRNDEEKAVDELVVPALIFPIDEVPGDLEYFYRENVVVPVVREVLKDRESDLPIRVLPVEPMIDSEIMEEGSEGGEEE